MFYIHSLMSIKKRIRISFAVFSQRMNKCLPLANVISLKAGEIEHQRLCKYSSKSFSFWLWCFSHCLSGFAGLFVYCVSAVWPPPAFSKLKKEPRAILDFQNNVDTSSPKSWNQGSCSLRFGDMMPHLLFYFKVLGRGIVEAINCTPTNDRFEFGRQRRSNFWIIAVNLYCRSLMTSAVRTYVFFVASLIKVEWLRVHPTRSEWLLLISWLYRQTANVPHIYIYIYKCILRHEEKRKCFSHWINIKIIRPCSLLDIQTVKFELFVSSSGRMGFPQCRNKISCKFFY